jgi:carbon-monoxide dehydrogenase medium subunit
MKKFDYFQPQSLKEAYTLMEKHKGLARYVAGGTDVIVRMKQRLIQPEALISLRGIEDLKGIHANGGLTLGSMTLFRDIERDSAVVERVPALRQAAMVLANPQVRNVATIGGNLANAAPSADCAPPLLVLEAVLVIEGPGGKREVPVDQFFTGPGRTCMDETEILTQIKIPSKTGSTGMAFVKAGRLTQDIAIVNASACVVMEGKKCVACRLATGAVAPVPLRLKKTEALVEGKEMGPDLLAQVKESVEKEVSPITDVRSTEEYRRILSGVLVKRAIEQAVESLS